MIRRRPRLGFTLVEVLMALALLVGVATAVYRSMAMSFETKRRVSDLNDRYHEGRQIMTRIAREIRTAFLHQPPPEQLREEDPAYVTRFLGKDDELYFATTSHLRLQANARESDQAEVHYFLGRGDRDGEFETGRTLFRRESRRVDDRPEKGGATWPVVEGVKTLKIEYWDDNKEIGDDAWTSDWDSDDNNLLPSRVRIVLELVKKDGGKPVRFVTQAAPRIRIPISPLQQVVLER